jgi:hypothetical protein
MPSPTVKRAEFAGNPSKIPTYKHIWANISGNTFVMFTRNLLNVPYVELLYDIFVISPLNRLQKLIRVEHAAVP